MENHPGFAHKLAPIFQQIAQGSLEAYTSVISVTEVLVNPIKLGNQSLVEKYNNLFTNVPSLHICTPEYQTALLAASIKANNGFKLPDSYQLAMAIESGCNTFLTNDDRLRKFPDIKVALVSQIL